jgi:Tol biopolymer transport system component
METPTLPDTQKRKSNKSALLWIAVIVLCLLGYIVLAGLMGWGFYFLAERANEASKIPYATATAAAQWPMVFQDDFGKVTEHWYTGDYTENGRRDLRSIKNGVYTWTLENADGYTYWCPSGAGRLTEFIAAVDVRHTAGTPYDNYGLIFGHSDDNYYVFAIQDSGYYNVHVWNADKWNLILPLSWSNAIKPGEVNRLMVLAEGGTFKLFINNEFVQEFQDSTLRDGDVGLMLNPLEGPGPIPPKPDGISKVSAHLTSSNSTSTAEFDNFEVRAPKGSILAPITPTPSPTFTPTQVFQTKPTQLPQIGPIQLPQIKPENGKLVFASHQAGYEKRNIFTILTDGSGLKQLTDGPGDDYAPRWSPDGKKIAFVSRRNGNPEIYVMDADGKNATRLTNNPAKDDSLDWSPDGKQIIFSSNRDGNYNLYRMPVEGENAGLSRLTDTSFDELDPSISPDGRQILFVENEKGTYKLSMMGIDDKQRKRLTDAGDVMAYSAGAWAPDGNRFAYVIGYMDVRDILIGDKKQITSYLTGDRVTWHQGMNLYPGWSPSGKQMVFVSDMDRQSDIYIILADGKGIFQVTHTEAEDETPDWAAP